MKFFRLLSPLLAIAFVALGMYGLQNKVEYAGWVLAIGLVGGLSFFAKD